MPFELQMLMALIGPILVIAAGYGLNTHESAAGRHNGNSAQPKACG